MAFDHEDLYTIMGVPRTASHDEIKRTYKQLALIHHPDRHGGEVDPAMADRFKEVATAYEVLGDDKARRKYDQELRHREQQRPAVGAFGREPRRANGLSPHVIHPTRPVRQAFVCECIDNMQRTFDIDATAFPSTLEHGDQVIVGGDTGVVLGVTEDAVWWWKNGCKLPSRLGSTSQFRIDGSGYALKWRRTGNVFVNQAKASRICELEKRRLDSLQRFKKKKKEQEQKETRDRKRQERSKAATKELAQIFSKEKVRRAQVEMELLVELSELFARIGFEQRVAAYWVETKSVFKGLVEAADEPPASRPLSRSSSALAGSLRLGSTLGQLSAASLPRLSSRLSSARALLSVAVDEDDDDDDDDDEGGEGMVQADFDELLNRSHRSACTFTTTTTSSSACCSDVDADDLLPLDTARTVRQAARPSASFPPPTLRFGVKKKEDEAAAAGEKTVKSPERKRKKAAKKPAAAAGTSPASTTTTATTANSSNGGFFSWETTRRPEPRDRKKSSTRKAVTPTSTKTAKSRSLSFGAAPQGGMARKTSTSPLPGRDHPHSQSMHVTPSSPVSMHSSRRSVYTSNTAGFVDPARGDIRVEPNRIGPSRRDGSNSPPLHRLASAAPAASKLGHKSSETPTSQSSSRKPTPPQPASLEGSSTSDVDVRSEDNIEELFEARMESSGWCNGKLFDDYRSFLSSSRVLRESWEKGSSLVDELGASLSTSCFPMFEADMPSSPSSKHDESPVSPSERATKEATSAPKTKTASSPTRLRRKPSKPRSVPTAKPTAKAAPMIDTSGQSIEF